MKRYIFGLIFSLTMVIALGVMGVEIFAHGIRNLTLIEVCAWITLACLFGNAIVALVGVFNKND